MDVTNQLTTEATNYMYDNEQEMIIEKLQLICNNSGSSIKASCDGNSDFVGNVFPQKVQKKIVSNEAVLKKVTPSEGYISQTFDSSNILVWSIISLISTYALIKKRYSNMCDK